MVDDHAFVPPDVVTLTEWVSEYYLAGPGATLAAALPPHGLTARIDRFKTVRIATLTAAGIDAAERLAAHSAEPAELPRWAGGRSKRCRCCAARLTACRCRRWPSAASPAATLARLKSLGLVAIRDERVDRDPFEHAVSASHAGAARTPTAEQQAALDQLLPLARAPRFHVALLHGVTGSGKTEVYLRLADAVRSSGRGVLMLVPEIALTPQVAALFRARFGEAVAIQHSGLSDGERHDQWHRIRRGDVDVVIGTRSAVFAPLANPGLIIVDEEHDTSYKQDETPRYHGRDVAIMRAKSAGALVVLGSATPTLESYANALSGRYTLSARRSACSIGRSPSVQLVNMRDEFAEAGDGRRAQPAASWRRSRSASSRASSR